MPRGRDIDGDWLADLTCYGQADGIIHSILSSDWSESTQSGYQIYGIPLGLPDTTWP